ncbi:hypothetical protein [Fusibacter sp. 3D3]|uniref:hypothetical protein n=1 Tax=Fusibacter sp. 3D3 TaxID=1048380 RepID=UPI000853CD31|nr:hypothetical protein [Fusibacter sp. 3D3]GAU77631.1 hypothetical protein F3D3_2260 [Fusibacter sp. 3D3]
MQKKWLIGIAFLISLTGCQKETVNAHQLPPTVTPPVAQVDLDKPVDKEIISEDLIGNFKYLDQNIANMTEEEATENFYELEALSIKKQFYYVEVISLNKHIQTELMKCFDVEKGEFDFGKYDGGSGMVIDEIYASGYKLVPYEGFVYPVTDYSKFKPYASFMSDEAQSYIDLKALESDAYTGTRSSLEVTQDELVNRILLAENHIRQYKNGKTHPMVLEMYKAYLYYYIPSTVLFDKGTHDANADKLTEYKAFVEAHPDTITAQIVTDYLGTLEANGYEETEAVKLYLKDFYGAIEIYISKAGL